MSDERVTDPHDARRQPAAARVRWPSSTAAAATAKRSTRRSCALRSRTRPSATIAAQVEAGIDIGNDGEQARESFFTYVRHRMNGFGDTSQRTLMRDLLDHPDFLELMIPRFARIKVNLMAAPAAISEVDLRRHDRARSGVRARRRRAVRRRRS